MLLRLFLRGGYRVCLYDVANVNEAMEDVKTSKLPLLDSFGMLHGHSVESRFPLVPPLFSSSLVDLVINN